MISDGGARRIGHVRRWQVAVVSTGCIAAMMLLWLSFEVDAKWQWWMRAITIVVIPGLLLRRHRRRAVSSVA